jgi:riboflavin kinase/FMN adenylyltransferase
MKIKGLVVRGAGRGAGIGFPTANLKVEEKLPENGVWAVSVEGYGSAVCNVGTRPTVDGKTGVHVEVHIPGFSGDLYGKSLEVTFIKKLRGERKFPGIAELKAQIKRDVEALRGV